MSDNTLLIILDGFGHREENKYNAINQAKTPFIDNLMKQYPNTLMSASGEDVGLPDGQMGNSEVGHMNLGAGRIVRQSLSRLQHDLKSGDFAKTPAFTQAFSKLKQNPKTTLHILGLLSPGGIHSHEDMIFGLLDAAHHAGVKQVMVHAFLDGRDTPPQSALASLQALEKHLEPFEKSAIASISGRYYAMDRDKRYDRTELVYDMLTTETAQYHANTAIEGLELAYERNENDEFVSPTWIDNPNSKAIQSDDTVIFMNFRADRARQLSYAFVNKDFDGFKRKLVVNPSEFITLMSYDDELKATVAYSKLELPQVFGEVLSENSKTQLRIAETEKYAHVTFFFNGGVEEPMPLEDRILVPSPKVATYDLQPEMNADIVTDKLIEAIQSETYDAIICNYANPDMVGHTGDFDATVKAIETLDKCLARLIPVLLNHGGQALVTADHGNAELMFNEKTQQPHTAHTNLLVPLIYVGNKKVNFISKTAILADIAPTLLALIGLEQPKSMTGVNLLQ